MIKIDINDESIGSALQALKNKLKSDSTTQYHTVEWIGTKTYAEQLERAFEDEYHCEIIAEDDFGLYGHIVFLEEKYATAFILRFSVEKLNV